MNIQIVANAERKRIHWAIVPNMDLTMMTF